MAQRGGGVRRGGQPETCNSFSMKQAQALKMQQQLADSAQGRNLALTEVSGSAGGGLVTATVLEFR